MLTTSVYPVYDDDEYRIEYFTEDLWTSEQETIGEISVSKIRDESGASRWTVINYVEVCGMRFYRDTSSPQMFPGARNVRR